MINFIDILLMLIFIAIAAAGYLGGTLRLLLVLISLYLSVVVAGFFYIPFAGWLYRTFETMDAFGAQMVAFLLLIIVTTAAVALSLIKTFGQARLPRFLAGLDQVGGGMLGVVTACFAAILISIVLRAFFGFIGQTAAAGAPVWPGFLALAQQTQASGVARLFLQLSTPLFILVQPWFPDGLPAILTPQ